MALEKTINNEIFFSKRDTNIWLVSFQSLISHMFHIYVILSRIFSYNLLNMRMSIPIYLSTLSFIFVCLFLQTMEMLPSKDGHKSGLFAGATVVVLSQVPLSIITSLVYHYDMKI